MDEPVPCCRHFQTATYLSCMLLLALAIAPGLAICVYMISRKSYRPEPLEPLLVAFMLGMLATVPALFLERNASLLLGNNVAGIIATSFLAIALIEESLKFSVVRLFAFNLKTFDEPMDGILYSVMVSMGFATVENMVYGHLNGYSVVFARMLTTVPAHASFGAIMGYYIGKAKFNPARSMHYFLKGLWLAIFFHGVFDSFILLTDNRWLKQYISEVLLFAGAVISLYTALKLSRRLMRLHQDSSAKLHRQGEKK